MQPQSQARVIEAEQVPALPAKLPVLTLRKLEQLLARLKGDRKHPLYVACLAERGKARGEKLGRRLRRKAELGMAGAF